MAFRKLVMLLPLAAVLAGCAASSARPGEGTAPVALDLTIAAPDTVQATYTLASPVTGLHFAQELGGYRAERWSPGGDGFRWVTEGDGERVERRDGQPFTTISFSIPIDYRSLPKNYAPFSPFSEGSALIYSGQFHACPAVPCDGEGPLPITIAAPGKIVGVEARRTPDRERFVSRAEGTSIFVGTLKPVESKDFIAIIDPGLPEALRAHLDQSLPQSIRFFSAIYGGLHGKPELYVSIDDRPEAHGGQSTQGGTLPHQIFMHFDGENAKARLTGKDPYWLDWFFAHEAAHLFQQDQIGALAGDEQSAWLHEGGADAMAALALNARGTGEQAYVRGRVAEAAKSCAAGLAKTPLKQAAANKQFDLYYQCGLLIWLAADQELRARGHDGLNDLNREFFRRVKAGQPWGETLFMASARQLGVPDATLARMTRISDGGHTDAAAEVAALTALAMRSLEPSVGQQKGSAAS